MATVIEQNPRIFESRLSKARSPTWNAITKCEPARRNWPYRMMCHYSSETARVQNSVKEQRSKQRCLVLEFKMCHKKVTGLFYGKIGTVPLRPKF